MDTICFARHEIIVPYHAQFSGCNINQLLVWGGGLIFFILHFRRKYFTEKMVPGSFYIKVDKLYFVSLSILYHTFTYTRAKAHNFCKILLKNNQLQFFFFYKIDICPEELGNNIGTNRLLGVAGDILSVTNQVKTNW